MYKTYRRRQLLVGSKNKKKHDSRAVLILSLKKMKYIIKLSYMPYNL